MTQPKLETKRGDTFSLALRVRSLGGPVGELTARAQLRDAMTETLTCELDTRLEAVDDNTVRIALSAPYTATEGWALGTHRMDVQLTRGELRLSTRTIDIAVVQDYTHD